MADYEIGARVTSTSDDAALKRSTEEVKRLTEETKKAGAAADETSGKRGGGGLDGLSKSFGALRAVVSTVIASAVFQKVAEFFRGIVSAAAEAEIANVKLGAVLRATGYSAGLSLSEIDEYATRLQRATGIEDEATKSAAALLATFKQIKGPQFFEVMDVVADMSVLFGSMDAAAIQLGKALQDPEVGLTALRRVGVSFTEDQMKLIKSLYDTGETAKGITVILEILRDQGIKDLAKEVGKTAGGEWSVFTSTLGEVKEKMGGVVTESRNYRGMLQALTWWAGLADSVLGKLVGTTEKFNKEIRVGATTKFEMPVAQLGVGPKEQAASEDAWRAAIQAIGRIIDQETDKIDREQKEALEAWVAQYKQKLREIQAARINDEREQKEFEAGILNDSLRQIKSYGNARQEISASVAETEKMAASDAAQMGINALAAAFPKSKGFAAAAALINTYQAASRALAEGGPYAGPFLAAAMIVAGMKQVQAIYATEPEGGGGGGGGASMGGGGRSSGATLGGGMSFYNPEAGSYKTRQSSQTWNNQNQQVSYNVSALTGSDAAETMRQFERKRHAPARAYKRTIVTRGSTTIGRQ